MSGFHRAFCCCPDGDTPQAYVLKSCCSGGTNVIYSPKDFANLDAFLNDTVLYDSNCWLVEAATVDAINLKDENIVEVAVSDLTLVTAGHDCTHASCNSGSAQCCDELVDQCFCASKEAWIHLSWRIDLGDPLPRARDGDCWGLWDGRVLSGAGSAKMSSGSNIHGGDCNQTSSGPSQGNTDGKAYQFTVVNEKDANGNTINFIEATVFFKCYVWPTNIREVWWGFSLAANLAPIAGNEVRSNFVLDNAQHHSVPDQCCGISLGDHNGITASTGMGINREGCYPSGVVCPLAVDYAVVVSDNYCCGCEDKSSPPNNTNPNWGWNEVAVGGSSATCNNADSLSAADNQCTTTQESEGDTCPAT
jgi:hypothetical protein